jgi:hypothetical protein
MSQKRAAVLVINPARKEAVEAASVLANLLLKADFDLFIPDIALFRSFLLLQRLNITPRKSLDISTQGTTRNG